ncbi:hypothetical protein [Flavobacterium sp.]|uniref:hypothetical protein n=1 Tax=Flavobacterium sp. TaxID=239 RepID=UPI0040483A6B
MNLHKVTKIAAIVISVLSIVFLVGLMTSEDAENSSMITPLIYLSYVILFACIALVLIYVFKNLVSKKEDLKKTMISIGLFFLVFIISFVLADGTEMKTMNNEVMATEATSKWVGTGLIMNAIIFNFAVILLVYSLLFKNAKK